VDPALHNELKRAATFLGTPSFAVRVADYAGAPVNKLIDRIPFVEAAVHRTVRPVLMKSLEVAIDSLEEEVFPPSKWLPKAMTGLTGGLGGLLGAAALPFELPLTTTLMLRAIADIARHHGEDLRQIEPRLACLEVFVLGERRSGATDELGYYAARTMFAKLSADLLSYLVEHSVIEASAPVVMRLISAVVARFGGALSERIAASAVPVLGAVSGSALNMIFMDHFERVAHGHFLLRRLEREHGRAEIKRLCQEAGFLFARGG
jgi:hypothetical protein